MNWYYVYEGQQNGPHSDEALQQLVGSGFVNATTLVWREGMTNWQPLAETAPEFLSSGPGVATLAGVACAECGGIFPPSELVSIGGASVCGACKVVRLQKLREGVRIAHRAGDLDRLLKIAKGQRGVNLAILLTFASYAVLMFGGFVAAAAGTAPRPAPSVGVLPFIGLVGILAAVVLQVLYVYRLASSLQHIAILWVLGVVFLSCIGLILLLILSSQATKELRAAGFKVGLLGGNPKEIERAMLGA